MMIKLKNLYEFLEDNPSEQDCINYFEEIRWKGKTPTSPFDTNSKVYKCKKGNRYQCKNTKKYFNFRTGTVFENSKIELKKWFLTLYLFASHKKGISSVQLSKFLNVTQKTSWFVLHRLRAGFDTPLFKAMLGHAVEIDETYLGGKNKNRHWNKKVPNSQGRSWKDKTPVMIMIERGGHVIAKAVPNVKRKTLEPIIEDNVEKGSNVYTDEWLAYKDLGKWYTHEIVNHRKKEYVNGRASTNLAENFNSHLKRGLNTYQWIKRKHAQKYVDEFSFRRNTKDYKEEDRFDLALLSMVGKRLTYQGLVG